MWVFAVGTIDTGFDHAPWFEILDLGVGSSDGNPKAGIVVNFELPVVFESLSPVCWDFEQNLLRQIPLEKY